MFGGQLCIFVVGLIFASWILTFGLLNNFCYVHSVIGNFENTSISESCVLCGLACGPGTWSFFCWAHNGKHSFRMIIDATIYIKTLALLHIGLISHSCSRLQQESGLISYSLSLFIWNLVLLSPLHQVYTHWSPNSKVCSWLRSYLSIIYYLLLLFIYYDN